MILLIAGAGESGFLADALVSAGFRALISTATDMPLDVNEHPNLSRRCGELNPETLSTLIVEREIRAIVDASHPYASVIKVHARQAANERQIPYLRWERPSVLDQSDDVLWTDSHEAAARKAFSLGSPVLLTTGSRNLKPYASESRRTGIRMVARVLDHPDSIKACRAAGMSEEDVIAGKGPFSVEQNVQAIKDFGIGVLVTKDSGTIGGVPEKLEAARLANCRVIVVRRPESETADAFDDVKELINAIRGQLSQGSTAVKSDNE
jgi:precorrin-6A/cobalt-precorrin-6A reductase